MSLIKKYIFDIYKILGWNLRNYFLIIIKKKDSRFNPINLDVFEIKIPYFASKKFRSIN